MSNAATTEDPVKRARELGPRIEKAVDRIVKNHAAMPIPADLTDPDIVLSECGQTLTALADECEQLREIESQWNDAVETGLILTDSGDGENGHTEL